jgi:hypothetical protein
LYLACFSPTGGESIREIDVATNVTTLAGSFTQNGYVNGAGSIARFNGAGDEAICFSQSMIFTGDAFNQRIRSITKNPTTQTGSPASLQLKTYAAFQNTYVILQLSGTLGRTYQIQSSPDMTTWTTRAALLLNPNPYLWIDQNPMSGNTFYRAVMLP